MIKSATTTKKQAVSNSEASKDSKAIKAKKSTSDLKKSLDPVERIYGFEPFVPEGAKILILGSMPSVKSLEQGFYYAHPQNRMFKLMACYIARLRGELKDLSDESFANLTFEEVKPLVSVDDRKQALSELKIAMWDVVASCERVGSLDSEIKAAEYADIVGLLKTHPSITTVITNGGFAKQHFARSTLKSEEVKSGALSFNYHALPSTSAANTIKFAKLKAAYDEVLVPLLFH